MSPSRSDGEDRKAYMAVNDCGCASGFMVAGIESERSEKAELKRWIKGGRNVEVTTVAEARKRMDTDWGCEHHRHVDDVQSEVDRLVAE